MIHQIYSAMTEILGPMVSIFLMIMIPFITMGGIFVWVSMKLDPGPPPEKSYDQLELEYSKMAMDAEKWMDEIHLERKGERAEFEGGKLMGYGQGPSVKRVKTATVKYHRR